MRRFAVLKRKEIVSKISKDDLYDSSMTEAIYKIRKLMALAESLEDGCIDMDGEKNGQIFSKKYDIWFDDDEWERV